MKELFGVVAKEEFDYFKMNTMLKLKTFIEPITKVEYLIEDLGNENLKAIAKNDNEVYEFFEPVLYPSNRQIELESLKSEMFKIFPDLKSKVSFQYEFEETDENRVEANLYIDFKSLEGTEEEKYGLLDAINRFINNYRNFNYIDSHYYVRAKEGSIEDVKSGERILRAATLLYNYGEPL